MHNVLLAFSDTGGGHRAAATALRDALLALAPDTAVSAVDPYALSHRWPFDRLAGAYPQVVNGASWLWRGGFRITDSVACTATLQSLAWPVLRRTFRELATGTRPDVVVSTHPLLTAPLRRVFPDVPLVVVVTDLASGHASWYHRGATLLSVPTTIARARAIACGVPAPRVEVHGVPVSPHFAAQPADRSALEERLGWSRVRPTVLLVGGGDGVGPLEALAASIDAAGLPCDLAVVAGRNAALAERLRARAWRGTVHMYGFVRELPAMMAASVCVLTKAGPGTISEACAVGVPLVLWGAIPGQESGNVHWVVEAGAGVWAPTPAAVTAAVREWTEGPAAVSMRAHAAEAARRMGRPHAAREIATRILALADGARGGADGAVNPDLRNRATAPTVAEQRPSPAPE
jgi:1,2-diacylglycerol 3-beta-galactosyltransferase